MPPRKRGTGEVSVSDAVDTTERLLHVTISQDHYRWLQQVAEERGSSIAVVSKQVFAQAVTGMQIAKAATVAITEEN